MYDDLNRLLQLTESNASGTQFLQQYTLNSDGTRATLYQYQVQSDGSFNIQNTQWSYDAEQRLTEEDVIDEVAGAMLYNDLYSYDLVGNRTQKIHEAGPNGRPTTTINYTYNANDEMASESDITGTISYDANGSQTNDGTHQYVYDVRNKLIQVTDESGNVLASYQYNDRGNRVSETTSSGTTLYLTDTQTLWGTTSRSKPKRR